MECEIFLSIIIHPMETPRKITSWGELLAWGYEQVGTAQLGGEVGLGARKDHRLTGRRLQAGPAPDSVYAHQSSVGGP